MLRALLILLALLSFPFAASAGDRAAACRGRPGTGWRRGRTRHSHAPGKGLARLLAQSRRRRPAHGCEVAAPAGFSAGPLRYPVPTRLTVAGLMNYVYERDYAVLVRLKVPASASGTMPIRADARWLACTDKICVPEQGELSLDLPVGSGTPDRAQFDEWRRALPLPLATPGHFELSGDKLRVAIPLPPSVGSGEPFLFPMTDGIVDYRGAADFPARWRLRCRRAYPQGPRTRLSFTVCSSSMTVRVRLSRCSRDGPIRRNADRRSGCGGDLLGSARRDRRADAPQPHALRVSDPRAEDSAPLARRAEVHPPPAGTP